MNTQPSTPNRRILVVDASQGAHDAFRAALVRYGPPSSTGHAADIAFDVRSALNSTEAEQTARKARFAGDPIATAFVDISRGPTGDGVDTAQRIWRADPAVQIVFCAANTDDAWHDILNRLAGRDRVFVLRKPIDPAEASQMATVLARQWAMTNDLAGRIAQLESQCQQRDAQLAQLQRVLITEQSLRRTAEQRLEHEARHDALTGLANRTQLLERLGISLGYLHGRDDYTFAVMTIDLDGFQAINDSLGPKAADQLLVGVAQRLTTCLRTLEKHSRLTDVVARLSSDEFVVLLDDLQGPEVVDAIVQRVQDAVTHTYELDDGRVVRVTAGIGIAIADVGYREPDELLRDADNALSHAKALGKGRYVIFDAKMQQESARRMQSENELRTAIDTGELELHYQPIVSLESGRIEGFESLVRWPHPEHGLIPPNDFIPLAEQTGLIVPLGYWVLHEACRQLAHWRERLDGQQHLSVSVNLSPEQFRQPDLLDQITRILEQTGLPAEHLKLEVTESAVMHDPERATEVLHKLRERNIRILLDDFGTGFSSLSYLHTLPIDVIKIDRSFVMNMSLNGEHAATIQAVTTLAENRHLRVIAEGIETADQLVQLQSLGCHFGQGYYFARPLDATQAEVLIRDGGQWLKSA